MLLTQCTMHFFISFFFKFSLADGIPIMTDFMEEVAKPLAERWKEFGIAIGIDNSTLDTIEQRNSTCESNDPHCFAEVFKEWEESKRPCKPITWLTIVSVMKYTLQEFAMADDIQERFLNQQNEETTNNLLRRGSDYTSGYSSLPGSVNQIRQSSSLSSTIYTGKSSGLSPPSSLSDNIRESTTQLQLTTNHSTASNVLPSPDYPYNSGNKNISSTQSSVRSELLFGNPLLPGNHSSLATNVPTWSPNDSWRLDSLQYNNSGTNTLPLYSAPQYMYQSSSSSSSSSSQIPRGGGGGSGGILSSYTSYSPNSNYSSNEHQYNPQFINTLGHDHIRHGSASPQRRRSPTFNQQSSQQSYNRTQGSQFIQQGSQFTHPDLLGSQFHTQGSPFTQGGLHGSQFSQGSLQGSPFTQGSLHGSQVSQGSLQGSPFTQGGLQGSQKSPFSQEGSPFSQQPASFSIGSVNVQSPQFLQGSQFPQASFSHSLQAQSNNTFLPGSTFSQDDSSYSMKPSFHTVPRFTQGVPFTQGAPFTQGNTYQWPPNTQTLYQQTLADGPIIVPAAASSNGHSDLSKQQLITAYTDSHEEQSSNTSYHSANTSLPKKVHTNDTVCRIYVTVPI